MICIKNNICEFRKNLNMTQDQLSEKTGLSQNTISQMENSLYNPSVLSAFKLCIALHCSVEDLFQIISYEE